MSRPVKENHPRRARFLHGLEKKREEEKGERNEKGRKFPPLPRLRQTMEEGTSALCHQPKREGKKRKKEGKASLVQFPLSLEFIVRTGGDRA